MRRLAAVLLVAAMTGLTMTGLTGCGGPPSDRPTTASLTGRFETFMASGSERSYAIEIAGQGLLALDIVDAGPPPSGASGVVVALPDGFDLPTEPAEEFDALERLSIDNGDGLRVLSYSP